MSEAPDELQSIAAALTVARVYSMEVEVIWSALQAIRGNSDMTIQEAVSCGLNEWDI